MKSHTAVAAAIALFATGCHRSRQNGVTSEYEQSLNKAAAAAAEKWPDAFVDGTRFAVALDQLVRYYETNDPNVFQNPSWIATLCDEVGAELKQTPKPPSKLQTSYDAPASTPKPLESGDLLVLLSDTVTYSKDAVPAGFKAGDVFRFLRYNKLDEKRDVWVELDGTEYSLPHSVLARPTSPEQKAKAEARLSQFEADRDGQRRRAHAQLEGNRDFVVRWARESGQEATSEGHASGFRIIAHRAYSDRATEAYWQTVVREYEDEHNASPSDTYIAQRMAAYFADRQEQANRAALVNGINDINRSLRQLQQQRERVQTGVEEINRELQRRGR